MRRAPLWVILVAVFAVIVAAQPQPQPRRVRPRDPRLRYQAEAAEGIVKEAARLLVEQRKLYERDIKVLAHLRNADDALADAMQPSSALQMAYEEVDKALSLEPEFLVKQGVIRMRQELDAARDSPTNADFGRLRSLLREEAFGPASRVAIRNAAELQEETVAWLKVQVLVADHLRSLSEISSESLRAAER